MRGFLPSSLFRYFAVIAAVGMAVCFPAGLHAATTVSNVRAGQRAGTKLVDIDYDITGPTGWVSVAVQVSADAGAS